MLWPKFGKMVIPMPGLFTRISRRGAEKKNELLKNKDFN